ASLPAAGAPAGRAWVSIRPLPYESRIGLLEFGRPWIGCRQARAVNHGKNWCRLVSAPASCRARYVASTTIAHQDGRPLDNHASRFVKIAIAHDWLVTLGGSELVLRELLRIFPGATVFTLIDKMPEPDRAFVGVARTRTSFLDRVPGVASTYRRLLPLFPAAMSRLDLGEFVVVLSKSHRA